MKIKHKADVHKTGGMSSCKVLLWESLDSLGPSRGLPLQGPLVRRQRRMKADATKAQRKSEAEQV